MARRKLSALFQTGSLALQGAQIVQLGAAYAARADHIDVIHHLGVHREDTLHALAKTDLADGDALAHAHAVAGNQHAFESLQALFLAFPDFHVNLDGITGAKFGELFLPLVLGNEFGQQRILHDNVRNLLVYNMFSRGRTSGGSMEACPHEWGHGSPQGYATVANRDMLVFYFGSGARHGTLFKIESS